MAPYNLVLATSFLSSSFTVVSLLAVNAPALFPSLALRFSLRLRIFPWLLAFQVSAQSFQRSLPRLPYWKQHPSPICPITLFSLWRTPLTWFINICLFLPGIHPCPLPPQNMWSGNRSVVYLIHQCVPSVQHIVRVLYRRMKENLLFQSHAYHVRTYVTVTFFWMNPRLYFYNLIF